MFFPGLTLEVAVEAVEISLPGILAPKAFALSAETNLPVPISLNLFDVSSKTTLVLSPNPVLNAFPIAEKLKFLADKFLTKSNENHLEPNRWNHRRHSLCALHDMGVP